MEGCARRKYCPQWLAQPPLVTVRHFAFAPWSCRFVSPTRPLATRLLAFTTVTEPAVSNQIERTYLGLNSLNCDDLETSTCTAVDFRRLISEIQRRHVGKVAGVYAVVGWVTIQVVATVFPLLGVSDVATKVVVILAILGFPISVALA